MTYALLLVTSAHLLYPFYEGSRAMQYTQEEKILLENANKIGRVMKPSDNDFIFIQLSPYLDNLMAFLKRLNPTEMQMVFMEYDGVMKVMRMIEDCAQQMEKELGLK